MLNTVLLILKSQKKAYKSQDNLHHTILIFITKTMNHDTKNV